MSEGNVFGDSYDKIHNPFSPGISTELLEEPRQYKDAFSQRILVSQTLSVYQPINSIVTGPQGCGKSMILNLIRYKILHQFLQDSGEAARYLTKAHPFLGISINLTRSLFHTFGRQSVSRSLGEGVDRDRETAHAADYLVQYLFREYIQALLFLFTPDGRPLRDWLHVDLPPQNELAQEISSWTCWSHYYDKCLSLADIVARCDERLNFWRRFLLRPSPFSSEIADTLSGLEDPLHKMGNHLRQMDPTRRVSLYVVVDQYEELIGLNRVHGTELQRVINSLIHARDPVVHVKMGVRTHDWGSELRVWGSSIKVEARRDYIEVDISSVLMRTEGSNADRFAAQRRRWLFAQFAEDVAVRRIQSEGRPDVTGLQVRSMFGEWNPDEEAAFYFRGERLVKLADNSGLPDIVRSRLHELIHGGISPLDLHLAIAWSRQKLNRKFSPEEVASRLAQRPWKHVWWRKERVEFALVQLASLDNRKRYHYGWNTVLMLSGANISAFLLIFGEVWDYLTKIEIVPRDTPYVPPSIQKEAILEASRKWAERDRDDHDEGSNRYAVLSRLGAAIRNSVIRDKRISNPGHTGFSLRLSDLSTRVGSDVDAFLRNGVKWGMFEVRQHTSKSRNDSRRQKYYLHQLLSPEFQIPFTRVKEPLYVNDIDVVYRWIFENDPVFFSSTYST